MRLALFLLAAASLAATARASEVGCPARLEVPQATASFYEPSTGNACGLPVAPGESIAAIAEADWNGSEVCGRCVRVTGPSGATTVRITDRCDIAFDPNCTAGFLVLSTAAFQDIGGSGGFAAVSWETVACDVAGPVVFYFNPLSSQFLLWLTIRNHRYGIAGAEMRVAGGEWTEIPRGEFNAFQRILTPPVALGTPVDLRITDVHGAVLESLGVPFTTGVEIEASGQFQTCPEPGAALAASAVLVLLGLRRTRR